MTSIELFYSLATVSLVLFTILGGLALFYCVIILRRVSSMMDVIEDFFRHFGSGMRDLAGRVQAFKDTADMIVQGVRSVSSIVSERKERRQKK